MAISNYSELVAKVQEQFKRSDLADNIPDFIALAEANLDRTLRSRSLIKRATAPLNEEYENLPPDFAAMERLFISNTNPRIELKSMTPAALINQFPFASGGQPRAYAIIGEQVQFAPVPAASANYILDLVYYQTVSSMALTSVNTTNAVLSRSPDIYLYATLVEAALFFQDDPATERFVALREAAVKRANDAGEESQHAGPLQMTHGMRGEL